MRFLRNISILKRLNVVTVIIAVALIVMSLTALFELKQSLLEDRREKVQELVEVANGTLNYFHQLELAGTLTRTEAQSRAIEILKQQRYENGNYFWVNDFSPKMIMHPTKPALNGKSVENLKDPNGKFIFKEMAKVARSEKQGFVDYSWPKPGFDEPVAKISFVKLFQPWDWLLGTGIYLDDVDQQFNEKAVDYGIFTFLVLLVVAVVTQLISRSIVDPLKATNKVMENIAVGEGDLTLRLEPCGNDEISHLSNLFNQFNDNLVSVVNQIHDVADKNQSFGQKLPVTVSKVQDLSHGQSEQMELIASAIEEMVASANEIADVTTRASLSAQEVDTLTKDGEAIVNESFQANRALSEQLEYGQTVTQNLEQESNSIGSVLDVIRGIAEQTNLLALNAAIEAARAGDQGRGFAVVADEVRTLASRTQASTDEIQKMIESLQSGASQVVETMNQCRERSVAMLETSEESRDSLLSMSQQVGAISDINHQIAAAAEQQRATLSEINNWCNKASYLSSQIAEEVEDTSSAATGIAEVSLHLDSTVSRFRTE